MPETRIRGLPPNEVGDAARCIPQRCDDHVTQLLFKLKAALQTLS